MNRQSALSKSLWLACCGLLTFGGSAAAQEEPAASTPPPSVTNVPSAVSPSPGTTAAPDVAPEAAPTPTPAPAPEPAPMATPAAAPTPAPPPVLAPSPAVIVDAEAMEEEPAPPVVKINGSFWSRYENRAGKLATGALGGRGKSDKVFYRARVGFTPAPLDLGHGYETTFYFEPQASGFYDAGGGVGSDELGLGVHQAYLSLTGEGVNWQIGRFEMIYGDHFIIGNVGWHQTGRAFNGGRLHIAPSADSMWLDVFLTLMNEGDNDTFEARPAALDYYFAGAYAGLGPMLGKGTDLDFYLLSKIFTGGTPAPGMSVDPAAHFTLGTRVKGQAGMLDYRLEAGLQFGANKGADNTAAPVDAFAYQADGEVGVTFVDSFRLAGAGFFASGDDPTTADKNEGWDQLFPTAHKFLGLSDIIGPRRNIAGGILRASYGLSKTVKAGVDAHFFTRPEAATESSYAGTELDFSLAWAIWPSLKLRGMYAMFIPQEDGPATPGGASDDKLNHYLEIELAQSY